CKYILASGGSKSVFTTASTCVSPAIATASGSFPTAAVFTTASVATPRVTRSSRGIVIEPSSPISVNIPSISKKDKGKGIMTEPKKPSKEKVLDQMSAQLAKELEEEFALEDQRIREQAERDSEIIMIHAQQELDMMIAELDRSNEMIAKHLKQQTKEPKELSEEELKNMIEIVPAEEVYIEDLQEKRLIIDWEVYGEGQIKYWKIVRVGDHTKVYQLFEEIDMRENTYPYGYSKNLKKMVKTGKTRTRERKENTKSRKMLSKVNKSQPLVNPDLNTLNKSQHGKGKRIQKTDMEIGGEQDSNPRPQHPQPLL
ncbi:hypothetical protein Tco_0916255, partial [Tanacetum coccineum]